MANQWLRLWHDMPTDPKWRTIARHAKQPISLVQAVYLHLLVDASRNVTRGHATVTHEDLASALDCDEQQISAILEAMQGRVLDGMRLVGWDKRQPKREDSGDEERGVKSASQRKREQRQREFDAMNSAAKDVPAEVCDTKDGNQCHAASRNVTLDKDKDKEPPTGVQGGRPPKPPPVEIPDWVPAQQWDDFVAMRRAKGKRAPFTVAAARGILADLDRLRGQGSDVADVLQQSITNGWSGVFAVKGATLRNVAATECGVGSFV